MRWMTGRAPVNCVMDDMASQLRLGLTLSAASATASPSRMMPPDPLPPPLPPPSASAMAMAALCCADSLARISAAACAARDAALTRELAALASSPSATSVQRRNLNSKAKFEGGSSCYGFKRSVPGAFNVGFIGSACTALPRRLRPPARAPRR